MYEQMDTEKVLNIAERMEALVEELRVTVVATSTETVEETAATVAETEIIEHEGLKLRKVNRVGREGDYVKIINSWDSDIKNGGFYKIERVDDELGIKDDDGFFWTDFHEDFKFVETYEVIDVQAEKLPCQEVGLTANQRRAALIERAKQFLAEYAITSHIVEFIVNRKKRTVVALIKEYETGKVIDKGIAKCATKDVFNQWIGKAIALARALKIDVPVEFLEAVQPDETVVGMIIEYKDGRIAEIINDNYRGHINVDTQTYLSTAREYEYHARIIEDTNAKYDEVI